WARLRTAKQQEIARLNGVYAGLLQKAGVTLFNGHARLLDGQHVEVDGKVVSARYILLATGGWPHVPDFPGREHVVTSNEIFDLPEFPRRILVAGGGYVAVEFAGIFSGLGAETLLAFRSQQPLKDFDADLRGHFLQEAGKHVQL